MSYSLRVPDERILSLEEKGVWGNTSHITSLRPFLITIAGKAFDREFDKGLPLTIEMNFDIELTHFEKSYPIKLAPPLSYVSMQ